MSEAIDLARTHFKPEDIILVAPCNVNPDTMNGGTRQMGYHITPPLLKELASFRHAAKPAGKLAGGHVKMA